MSRRAVAVAITVGLTAVISLVGSVMAASPAPSDAIGGDPRSVGQGPGLVGDPATAVLLVVAIGLAALVLTLLYVKLTGGRRT